MNGFFYPYIFNRPGDDLLFRALRRSTIGTIWFHFRVRDGTGWDTNVMTTRSIKDMRVFFNALAPDGYLSVILLIIMIWFKWASRLSHFNDDLISVHDEWFQVDWVISTGQLHALPRFHIQPINVVVFHGSQGEFISRWVSRLDAFSGYPVHT